MISKKGEITSFFAVYLNGKNFFRKPQYQTYENYSENQPLFTGLGKESKSDGSSFHAYFLLFGHR